MLRKYDMVGIFRIPTQNKINHTSTKDGNHRNKNKTSRFNVVLLLWLEHVKNTNSKSQTHTHKERKTKIYEVRQDFYVPGQKREIY